MTKKWLQASLALTLVTTSLLTGCSKSTDSSSATSSSSSSPQATAKESSSSDKEVKLKFISWWAYIKPEQIKKFEDANPGIKVDYEYVAPGDPYFNKLKSLSAANQLPDVFGMQNPQLSPYVSANQIMDLKDAFKTPAFDKSTPWGETINPVLIENMNAGLAKETDPSNHVWGVPFGAISVAVVYNKTLFDKVGIKPPTTWEEFESNSAKLKQAGLIPMSYVNKVGWGDWWFRLLLDQTVRDVKPDDFNTGKAKMTDPGFVDALKKVKEMWDNGTFDPAGMNNGIDETQALFVQQKLAQYMVVPENFVKYLQDNKPQGAELGAYLLPAWKGINPSRTLGGAANIAVVSATSKHKEESIKLIKFLTSETMFQTLSSEDVVPSTKGYTPPAGDQIMGAYAKAAENGFIVDHLPAGNDEFNDKLFKDVIPKVLLTNKKPEDGLKEAQDILDKAKK
ncbi:hypothetical protein A8709_20995 [Paenibacillus pectinilyticus]|uniref:ABC transporter substrate-binding protein n=1 Tax=Paenibacillus pectinilyticus TaxID=512399 RepID=A0A1C0ZXL7_9BACL|nr:extracellular solute-binding protein [Paenibacillus pectinilyticus]OCT12819.1 hypothetical protein A8709_20995 [Paenibacillus pectinilyticus]